MPKNSMESVIDIHYQSGFILKSTNYIDADTPHETICRLCSFENKFSLTSLRNGVKCLNCRGNINTKNKYSQDEA